MRRGPGRGRPQLGIAELRTIAALRPSAPT